MSDYLNNGQYVLDKIKLTNVEGSGQDEIDLMTFFVEANLYESIEDKMMSGNVSIADTLNLNEILPLAGGEKIELEFFTATNEQNAIKFIGEIYKIDPKHRLTEHSTGYTIYFASTGSISSDRTKVNEGYSLRADEIVETLYRRYIFDDNEKPLFTSHSKGICDYTFGNITPLEAITILERFASSTSDYSGFVFFENNKNFVFKPLQELYQQPPVANYNYGLAGVYEDIDTRYEESFERVQAFKVYDENSLSDRIQDGLHGSKHAMFDLVTKTFLNDDSVIYDKESWFDQSKSLGKHAVKKSVQQRIDNISMTYGSGEIDLLLHRDRINAQMKKIELELFTAEMLVFGDSKLKCGDIVNCFVPNLNIEQKDIQNSFSGKFLITAIKHTLRPQVYTQTIQIQKDSYEDIIQ